ncbi:hypothetical protein GmRootA79_53010 (plasmid) [Acidovorax sp. A79]|uniref:IPTL-CTERM sorting domain-containing protein n=1 Tax=Acidovorax sp. A79 TaxID=3056107 RepID=UPI0034E84B0D
MTHAMHHPLRHWLAAVLATAAACAAQAAPFAITSTGTIDQSTFAEIRDGERYAVTMVYDNGGNTAQSQTWRPADLRCVIWRMNNAANVVYTQASFNGAQFSGPFTATDASGALLPNGLNITSLASNNNPYTVDGLVLATAPSWNAEFSGSINTFSEGISGGRSFRQLNLGLRIGTANPVAVASDCEAPPLPPGVPTQAAATPGDGEVAVRWQAPAGGAVSATPVSYTVTALNLSAVSGTCTAPHPATNCTVSGLSNGTSYRFLVRAAAADGSISPPSLAFATPSANPAPGAPTGVTAQPGNGQITLNWLAPVGGTPPVSYTVTASQGGASCTVPAPTTRCTVPGLTNGTAYTLWVTATGANGSVSANSFPLVIATPRAMPPGPGGVQPVPTLSQWGVLLLSVLVLLAVVRRRAIHS